MNYNIQAKYNTGQQQHGFVERKEIQQGVCSSLCQSEQTHDDTGEDDNDQDDTDDDDNEVKLKSKYEGDTADGKH